MVKRLDTGDVDVGSVTSWHRAVDACFGVETLRMVYGQGSQISEWDARGRRTVVVETPIDTGVVPSLIRPMLGGRGSLRVTTRQQRHLRHGPDGASEMSVDSRVSIDLLCSDLISIKPSFRTTWDPVGRRATFCVRVKTRALLLPPPLDRVLEGFVHDNALLEAERYLATVRGRVDALAAEEEVLSRASVRA